MQWKLYFGPSSKLLRWIKKCYLEITDLWLHKHQIDKQHNKIMLNVFVRKPLASRALRQPYIPSSSSPCRLDLRSTGRAYLDAIFSGLGRRVVGGAPIVAAMKNMVELRNWVTTFDADGHAKVIYMVRDT